MADIDESDVRYILGRVEGLLTGRFDEVSRRLDGIGKEQGAQRQMVMDLHQRQARLEEQVSEIRQSRQGTTEWIRTWGGWIVAVGVELWAYLHPLSRPN